MKVPFMDLSLQNEPLARPLKQAIQRVMYSNQFYGKEVEAFEAEWAEYCGAKYCVACSSGTSALELALRAHEIGVGHDEVIVPANTFIATAEAVTAVGAIVKFADVDPVTYCVTPETVKQALTPNTKAVIVVHLYGRVVPLGPIHDATPPGTVIIADAAQAHGAFVGLKHVGGLGTMADATSFSFYPTKNLGAMGDAGAVMTYDPKMADWMRSFRDHGRVGHHEHAFPGYNHRMDAIQAAILRVKLPYLDEWNYERVALARRYKHNLDSCSNVTLPTGGLAGNSVFYLYVVTVDHRVALRAYLEKAGIGTGIHYPRPLPSTQAYLYELRLPVAEGLAPSLLSLPMYPGLKPKQVDYVCDAIKKFYSTVRK